MVLDKDGSVRARISIAAVNGALALACIAVLAVACGNGPAMTEGFTPDTRDAGSAGSRGTADAAVAEAAAVDEDAGIGSSFSPSDRGMIAVAARGCAGCHQSANADDGVLSGQLSPVPGTMIYGPNLTPDRDTGIGGWTDDEIVRAIRDGIGRHDVPLCDVMPRFSDLGMEEGAGIVAYLRGIPPVAREIPDGECPGSASPADGGSDAQLDASTCGVGWVGPSVSAACHACMGRPCQLNGCFGGYFCDTSTWTCHAPCPL